MHQKRQADLTRITGVSQQTLSHIIAGRRYPNRDQAFVLAHATGLPVEKLMDPKRIIVVRNSSQEAGDAVANS